MCGLEAYADASVGSLGIEHRKRTTIAVELAAKVSIQSSGFKFDTHIFPAEASSVPRRAYFW